jgi:electron transport complex protein RnfB
MMNLMTDILLLTGLGAFSALLLVITRDRLEPKTTSLITLINSQLPQTQCAQCSYPGCKPYAEAIANGEAINRCPPGGEQTITALANLLGREPLALNDECGEFTPPMLAVIREEECIGCTLCIAACPVDAIVGAHQLMHTVIAADCTGCDLCRDPCPVDCIDLVEIPDEEALSDFREHSIPCINCGQCSEACPRNLQPQMLYWFRENRDQTHALNLDSCIVCGLCDNVCPSEIPLTHTFRVAKQRKTNAMKQEQLATETEERYLAREDRLANTRQRVAKRPSKSDRQLLLDTALSEKTALSDTKNGGSHERQ